MNEIQQLSFGNDMGLRTATARKPEGSAQFSTILDTAISDLKTADAQFATDTTNLLTGQTDDLAQVTIDATKAQTALSLVVNVRDRAVDAYKEIMQMSL